MAKIKQFEGFTKIVVAYKKNWVYMLAVHKPATAALNNYSKQASRDPWYL